MELNGTQSALDWRNTSVKKVFGWWCCLQFPAPASFARPNQYTSGVPYESLSYPKPTRARLGGFPERFRPSVQPLLQLGFPAGGAKPERGFHSPRRNLDRQG